MTSSLSKTFNLVKALIVEERLSDAENILKQVDISSHGKATRRLYKKLNEMINTGRKCHEDLSQPLITIITVNYNDACGLLDTIKSVVNQDYNYELIVVDGYSNDASFKVIEDFSRCISQFVSEPDNGIYNAMNKGIDMASGKYSIFMNSGDMFYDNKVLNTIPFSTDADLIYGKAFNFNGKEYGYNDELWKGMIFSHQSVFIKTDLLKKYRFSENLKIVSDYELLVKCDVSNSKFHNCKLPIAKIDTSGVSFTSFKDRTIERFEVAKKYYGKERVSKYYTNLLASQ